MPRGPGQPLEGQGLSPTWWYAFSLLHIRPHVRGLWLYKIREARFYRLKELRGSLRVREEALGKYTSKDGDVPMEVRPGPMGTQEEEASCSVIVRDASWGGSRTALKEEGKTGTRSEAERGRDAWEIMGNTGPGVVRGQRGHSRGPLENCILASVPGPDLTKGSDISLHAALPSVTLPHPLAGLFLPHG